MELKKLFMVIIVVSLPLLILLGTARQVAFDEDFYRENMGIDDESAMHDVMDYLSNDKVNLESDFNQKEMEHMKDVKLVMNILWAVYFILLIITVIIMLIFVSRYKDFDKIFGNYLLYGGIATFGFLILLGLFALISFDLFFDSFHKLFFASGTWTFSMDDLLIRMFPYSFFQSAVKRIFTLSFVKGFFIMFFGIILKPAHKKPWVNKKDNS